MQVQIRNPIAVEVKSAGDIDAVSLEFFTAADHQAAVTLEGTLITELFDQLKVFLETREAARAAAEQAAQEAAREAEKPQPVKRKEFFVVEQKPARQKEAAMMEQPILRALLQA